MRICVVLLMVLCGLGCAEAEPIAGRVMDDKDRAVAGVRVLVEHRLRIDSFEEKISDAQGRFAFDLEADARMPNDFGRVVAFHPDYAVAGGLLKRGANVLRLTQATAASGIVQDEAGRVVAAARVRLHHVSGIGRDDFVPVFGVAAQFLSAVTDDKGRWTIGHLPKQGQAIFEVDDARFERVQTSAKLATHAIEAPPLIVKPGASIAGRVVDEKGQPLAGITLFTYTPQRAVFPPPRTSSDVEGQFAFLSLSPGSYNLQIIDPKNQRAAVPRDDIEVAAGETKTLGDISLTPGVVITGRVSDGNGKPISGVSIGAFSAQQFPSLGGAVSDKEGRYRLRVAPTVRRLAIMSHPEEFLRPAGGDINGYAFVPMIGREGQSKTRDWTLRRGASLRLKVLWGGRALPNVTVVLEGNRPAGDSGYRTPSATSDAQGRLEFKALRTGVFRPVVEGAWQTASPLTIEVGQSDNAAQQLAVKPRLLLAFKGRVVTPQGRPVAGATIEWMSYRSTPTGGHVWSLRSETVRTDAQGRYSIPNVAPHLKIDLNAHKPNHHRVWAQVTQKNGRYIVPDIVLAPFDATIAGRVLDEQNRPVAGAKVLCPTGLSNGTATSDALGRFQLKQLPDGAVRVLAAHQNRFGQAQADTIKKTEATIVLRALPPLKPADVWRAREILDETKADSRRTENDFGGALALELVPYDYDLALELAAQPDGSVSDGMRWRLLRKLAQQVPEQAAAIALNQLDLIKNPASQLTALTMVGVEIAPHAPDTARGLWQRLKAILEERKRARAPLDGMDALWTMKLAAATGQPERDEYLEQARQMFATQDNRSDYIGFIASGLAPFDAPAAEAMLRQLPGGARNMALGDAIKGIAPHDLKTALRWLDWLESQPKSPHEADGRRDRDAAFGRAAPYVIRALGPTDAAGALAIARRVQAAWWRGEALLEAARFQSKAVALEIMDDVEADNESQSRDDTKYRAAALALDVDAKIGRQIFESQRAKFERGQGGEAYSAIPNWAFYYARIDRAASKIWLERAWSRWGDFKVSGAYKIALAMAPCDFDRALEMARQLQSTDRDTLEARRKLARYLLLDDEARRDLNFHNWAEGMAWNEDDD